jgi:DNA-binding MarR family transcriptional regulator
MAPVFDDDDVNEVGGPLRRPPVVPALAGYTGHLLRAAYVAALRHARRHLPPDRQPREFGILVTLATSGPRSQQQLAELMDVNRTIMVKVVDRLEAAGLVERRRNPADRRSYALEPTEEGLATLAELGPSIAEAEAKFTARLTAAERDQLNARLRELLAGLGHEHPPEALADRTGYLLAAAHHRTRDAFAAALVPSGIEPRHFGALATIVASAPCSQQLVAEQLGVSGPVVVALVDELEERGLVTRGRNAIDRRSYALEPTEEGRAVLANAQALVDEFSHRITAALGEEHDAQLRALLRKLLGVAPAAD